MPKLPVHRPSRRRSAAIAIAVAIATGGAGALPAAASASSSQITIIQDNSDLINPAGAFAQFRELGASTVRVIVPWSQIAPGPKSRTKPKFNATDPNAYPAAGWVPYDNIVREASVYHLTVDLTVTGGAPRWAEKGNPPQNDPFFAWKPSAADYGQFVQAVGERYDGHFTPRGQTTTLPAVHFWALYNEPNFGQDLGPQAIDGSRVSIAPMYYRSLLDAGWRALHATGHGRDTILIGEFAARGNNFSLPRSFAPQGLPGDYGQTKPLLFVQTLYCVNTSYQQLRGSSAAVRGCPANAAGSRRFRSQNPGLFLASGVSDHPYPSWMSPVTDGRNDPDFATLPDLGNLQRALDRAAGAYGSHRQVPLYNTEYGYITSPPKAPPYVSPNTAAYYINWAEYLSYRNRNVRSYMQYLLTDPPPNVGKYAGFASGLETYRGAKKATFYAFRMPLYMPRTTFSRSQSVEVWGARDRRRSRPWTVSAPSVRRSSSSPAAVPTGRSQRSTSPAPTAISTCGSDSRPAARSGSRGPIQRRIRCSPPWASRARRSTAGASRSRCARARPRGGS